MKPEVDQEEPRYTMTVRARERLIARLACFSVSAFALGIETHSKVMAVTSSVLAGLAAGHLTIRHSQIKEEGRDTSSE